MQVLHVVQVVLQVVPAHQHLEQRLLARRAVFEPGAEKADELLGYRGERGDALGSVGGRGVGGKRLDLVGDAAENGQPLGVDERLVEPPEPDAAGQVADHRIAQLGRAHHPLEQLTRRCCDLVSGCGRVQPALQQRDRHLDVGRRALLGDEDPEDGLLERGRSLEIIDAVVREHAYEPVPELLG